MASADKPSTIQRVFSNKYLLQEIVSKISAIQKERGNNLLIQPSIVQPKGNQPKAYEFGGELFDYATYEHLKRDSSIKPFTPYTYSYNSKRYKDISSFTWMISNRYYHLILEKIKRNDYIELEGYAVRDLFTYFKSDDNSLFLPIYRYLQTRPPSFSFNTQLSSKFHTKSVYQMDRPILNMLFEYGLKIDALILNFFYIEQKYSVEDYDIDYAKKHLSEDIVDHLLKLQQQQQSTRVDSPDSIFNLLCTNDLNLIKETQSKFGLKFSVNHIKRFIDFLANNNSNSSINSDNSNKMELYKETLEFLLNYHKNQINLFQPESSINKVENLKKRAISYGFLEEPKQPTTKANNFYSPSDTGIKYGSTIPRDVVQQDAMDFHIVYGTSRLAVYDPSEPFDVFMNKHYPAVFSGEVPFFPSNDCQLSIVKYIFSAFTDKIGQHKVILFVSLLNGLTEIFKFAYQHIYSNEKRYGIFMTNEKLATYAILYKRFDLAEYIINNAKPVSTDAYNPQKIYDPLVFSAIAGFTDIKTFELIEKSIFAIGVEAVFSVAWHYGSSDMVRYMLPRHTKNLWAFFMGQRFNCHSFESVKAYIDCFKPECTGKEPDYYDPKYIIITSLMNGEHLEIFKRLFAVDEYRVYLTSLEPSIYQKLKKNIPDSYHLKNFLLKNLFIQK